jgi:hypothetical protein
VGDDWGTGPPRARGRSIVVPPGGSLCGADIALLVLDQGIDDVAPALVRTTGAAEGDRVRIVGFGDGASAPSDGAKLVREHVAVLASDTTELEMADDVLGGGGGPALDGATAEVLGVASRNDGDARDVYTRADVFLALVDSALAQSRSAPGTASPAKVKKRPTDIGATCDRGADCAAGVCVSVPPAARYCSRTCAGGDRCPTNYRCARSAQGVGVCVAT